MSHHARYQIEATTESQVTIRDVGAHDGDLTVTNDAEWVVFAMLSEGTLKPGQRLYYYDSDGALDEIVVHQGRFAGFAPVPRPRADALRCHIADETCTPCPRCVGSEFIPTTGMPPCTCDSTGCDNPNHRELDKLRTFRGAVAKHFPGSGR